MTPEYALFALLFIGGVTYFFAARFGGRIQPVYDTGMTVWETGRAIFTLITVFVFATSGSTILFAMAVLITIAAVLYLYFDYYSPGPNPAR